MYPRVSVGSRTGAWLRVAATGRRRVGGQALMADRGDRFGGGLPRLCASAVKGGGES